MLPRLALFCFCFTVISAKPANEVLEDIEHTKFIQKFEFLDKILIKLVQRATSVQQLASARSVEAHQSLSLLPSKCSVDGTREIEIERKDLLAKYYKCSILQILEDIASLGLDSAKYAFSTYKDTALIAADILACTSAGFNPFIFISCIFKAVKIIPDEVKDIIALTEGYMDAIDTLVPSIYQGIESCFNKTSKGYERFLDDVFEIAKVCDDSWST